VTRAVLFAAALALASRAGAAAGSEACAAASAVFLSGAAGSEWTSPLTCISRTPGLSSRTAVTTSRAASNAWPRMSKPTPTLPMLAGALAVADCRNTGVKP